MYGHQVPLLIPMASSGPYNTLRTHKIASYHLTETETKALTDFKHTMFSYTCDRHSAFELATARPDSVTKGLQEYVIHNSSSLSKEIQSTEVAYLSRVSFRGAGGGSIRPPWKLAAPAPLRGPPVTSLAARPSPRCWPLCGRVAKPRGRRTRRGSSS